MVFRFVDAALALSLAAAGVTGVRWLADSSTHRTAQDPEGTVTVQSYAAEYSPCTVLPTKDGRTAQLEFAAGPGETFVGITSAKLFPVVGPRVAVERWDDVVTAHVATGLDLGRWVAKRSPSGPYALLFALCVDGAAGQELRIGWTRFEASDLSFGVLRVQPRTDGRCRIDVTTAAGQAVPGALVGLAPPVHQNGLATVFVTTGGDGACIVSGLGARAWTASLPQGVGPDRTQVSRRIDAGAEARTLVSPLRGAWTFVDAAAELPFRGASLLVEETAGATGPPRAWPVSPLVVPGSAGARRWTWMLPAGAGSAGPVSVAATFRGFGPVHIDDAGRPFTVRSGRDGRLTATAGAAVTATATASVGDAR